jgi:hypothetical protein
MPRVFKRAEMQDALLVEGIKEDIYADFMSSPHQNAVRFNFSGKSFDFTLKYRTYPRTTLNTRSEITVSKEICSRTLHNVAVLLFALLNQSTTAARLQVSTIPSLVSPTSVHPTTSGKIDL